MVYRIYTENKNKAEVAEIVSRYFEGFTMYEGEGYWEGKPEPALIIEVLSDNEATSFINKSRINAIAKRVKLLNDQQAVLCQEIANNNWLI